MSFQMLMQIESPNLKSTIQLICSTVIINLLFNYDKLLQKNSLRNP